MMVILPKYLLKQMPVYYVGWHDIRRTAPIEKKGNRHSEGLNLVRTFFIQVYLYS